MKVSTAEPFQIIYSLFEHEFLGHLFAAYVVQLGPREQLTLLHQTVSGKNAHEFTAGLDATDFELVELCDQMQQEAIVKDFWPRKIATAEFFLKTYHPEKGDKPLHPAYTPSTPSEDRATDDRPKSAKPFKKKSRPDRV